ncbi:MULTISPECIES: ABC transporter permease [unclassified Lentimicrobium]|uniref:ABC transporter permease n=1 Tax=unclassified Lentimicrobium TaxID=2677434 RepID=UPI00155648E8|nr:MULTISPECIES: ABC transporter permease [unclassified Lentimicrobium]NPD47794.1 FtsX-like permease family protein [Lentimicrobium sp. S6]NPD86729.1 FtsX-like permease family protein [Lentimicrobium sp. L6]
MNIGKIIRRIKKNKLWFGLNVLGLSVAFACLLLVYSFVSMELSYDKFHSNSDRIYRLTSNSNTGASSMVDARTQTHLSYKLNEELPQVEEVLRLTSFRNAIISIEDNSFYSKKVYAVDSSFFQIFDFELLVGDAENIFNHPKHVVITERFAKTHFGHTDVIGEKIFIVHQRDVKKFEFTIQGVLKDPPSNSHFNFDILTSREEDIRNTLDYTYLLLAPETNTDELLQEIQAKWDEKHEGNDYQPLADLQALTRIHLHSHKSRELEKNSSFQSILLLLSSILIIMLIAFINYSNLNFVQFISDIKTHKIKLINGAKKRNVLFDTIKETIILNIIIIALSFFLAQQFSSYYHFLSFFNLTVLEIIFLLLGFALLVILNSIWPLLVNKISIGAYMDMLKQKSSYKVFVILQLALTMISLSSILILHKQLNHINSLHPDAESMDMVVIPENPWDVVSNYEVFKEKLKQHPEIIDVTSVMEEPAGMVTDNFPYEIEGKEKIPNSTLNILCVDSNFFSFLDINAIAGKASFGQTSSMEWEQKALRLWQLSLSEQEIPKELEDEVSIHHSKYIINKTALKHMGFENPEDAIGQNFRFEHMEPLFPFGPIIGVVEDFHYTNLYAKEKPMVMVSRKVFSSNFLIRIELKNRNKALKIINEVWTEVNPDKPFAYEFASDSYEKVYEKEYTITKVLSLFTIVSLILSGLGLFAMVSFNLARRKKEIGLRKINGAKVSEILSLLFKSYSSWVFIAFILATPISYMLMNKWLEGFAYKTNLDVSIFILAGLITLCFSFLIVAWKSYKSARRNPAESIRYE